MPLGSIISGLGTIAGGLFGNASANSQRKAAQRAANRNARLANARARAEAKRARAYDKRMRAADKRRTDQAWRRSRSAAKTAYARQRALSSTAISRTVADARRAGINPLVALGASTSPSVASAVAPQSYASGSGYSSPSFSSAPVIPGQPASGNFIGDGLTRLATAFDLENRGLQNQLLRAQIKHYNTRSAATVLGATSRTAVKKAENRARDLQAELLVHPKMAFDFLGGRWSTTGDSSFAGPMTEIGGEPADWLGALGAATQIIGQLSSGGFLGAGRRYGIARRRYTSDWRP